MQGADHEPVQLLLLELVDRDRTRATGVVAPPAPPYLLLSHGEEFEERVRLASEAVARFDLYVELLCLEAVDRVVVEYFDVSVGWVQQQQQQQLEQHEQFEQQQQLELQQLVQRQRKKLKVHEIELGGIAVAVGEYYTSSVVALCVSMCELGAAWLCLVSWMDEHTDVDDGRRASVSLALSAAGHARRILSRRVGVWVVGKRKERSVVGCLGKRKNVFTCTGGS